MVKRTSRRRGAKGLAAVFRRRLIQQRLWKALNVVVTVTMIANLSAIGALIAPSTADAARSPVSAMVNNASSVNVAPSASVSYHRE